MLQRYADLVESMLPRPFEIPTALGPPRSVHCFLLAYSQLVFGNTIINPEAFASSDDGVWSGLIFHAAGERFEKPEWIERSRKTFQALISAQQPTGAFFAPDIHANPETRWYQELITMHAIASYAVRVRDDAINRAVARGANYHLHETQPDHATAEPWGLLAFIQYAPPLADQVLHAMSMQYPQGISGVPLLLMTDVLYGLKLLNARGVAVSDATGGG